MSSLVACATRIARFWKRRWRTSVRARRALWRCASSGMSLAPWPPRGTATALDAAGVHDVGYDDQRVLVELDGLTFHGDLRSRVADTRRDRRGAGRGWLTVRVVWVDVALHACTTAVDVGDVLNDRGWMDRVTPCRRRGCAVRPDAR